MPDRPVIAIAAEVVSHPAQSAFRFPWNISSQAYVESIRKAGGIPYIIPSGSEELIEGADGLLLQGGKDVTPSFYKEERSPLCRETNVEEDEFQCKLIMAAERKGIPVLGICRGIQIINTAFSGTLYQDQSEGGFIKHDRLDRPEDGVHEIFLEEGSFLEKCFRKRRLFVNSLHHQMVKDVAPGFKVSARSQDGSVEAIERGNMIAVQWHPEAMLQKRDEMLPLFSFFIALCNCNR